MPDLIPEPLPEVEFTPYGLWLVILAAFLVFWVLFWVNAFIVGIFTDMSVGVIAALAAIGQIIIIVTMSAEQMLGALVARAGIKVKPKK